MIKVLTIEREYGSGAAEIAEKLAERLGWKLWDQLLTNEIARHLECDSQHVEQQEERKDPLYYRLFKSFLRGSFEGSQITPRMKMADAEGIREVAEQAGEKGGRRGQRRDRRAAARRTTCETAPTPSTFSSMRLSKKRCAGCSRRERARRRRCNSPRPSTRTARPSSNSISESSWPARHFFHLMVNSTMGEAAVVQTVLDGLSAIQKR